MNPFTIFIPVYNEEELLVRNIERLMEYLNSLNTPYEIIIGSNGSTDTTPDLGKTLATQYSPIQFFHIAEKGPGSALRQAIPMASYEHILSVDMDLSVDLDFIKRANILLSDYDFVVGSKRMASQQRSRARMIASASFVFCAMILLGLSFDDYSLAAKGYKRKLLEGCIGKINGGTFYVIEVADFAIRNNYKTVQIPAPCCDNRKSRFNLLHEGFYRFGNLFRLWMTRGR